MSWFSTPDGDKIKVGNLELDLSDIFTVDVSYAPFTEYGRRPEPTNVIDSDAIVIDPDVLTLPAPMTEKEIVEKYDAIFLEIIDEVKRERNDHV